MCVILSRLHFSCLFLQKKLLFFFFFRAGGLSSLLAASVHRHISLYVKYPEMKLHRSCPFRRWTNVLLDGGPQADSSNQTLTLKVRFRSSVYLLISKASPQTSHPHKGRKERKLLKKEQKTCKNQADAQTDSAVSWGRNMILEFDEGKWNWRDPVYFLSGILIAWLHVIIKGLLVVGAACN